MHFKKITVLATSLAIAMIAAPASAQSLSDTHELVWGQAGKVPAVSYRPLKRSCAEQAAPIHLAGKTPFIVHAKSGSDCGKTIATNERNGAGEASVETN